MSTETPDDEPLYANRSDWKDVEPLEQYEDINPLAPIFYTEECEQIWLSLSSMVDETAALSSLNR